MNGPHPSHTAKKKRSYLPLYMWQLKASPVKLTLMLYMVTNNVKITL
nr:unnamed protein product [Callosobruchus analis]